MEDSKHITIGTRVVGNSKLERHAGRQGEVVGSTMHVNCVRVLWDGLRTPVSIHIDFLELA